RRDCRSVQIQAPAPGPKLQGGPLAPTPYYATISRTTPGALTPSTTLIRSTYSTLGQTITYSYTLTNTENVTLSTFTITDDHISSNTAFRSGAKSWAPGAWSSCTAS